MGRSALILGATGLVGKELTKCIANERAYEKVHVLVRRPLETEHPKLMTLTANLEEMEKHPEFFEVDDIYCCLGTTIKKAGTKDNFKTVDLEFPLRAAELGLRQGASQYIVISSLGADEKSPFFYSRVKGELESKLKAMSFKSLLIFRPSLLLGEREEIRTGEKLAEKISAPLGFFFKGGFEKYRPIHGKVVAEKMLEAALNNNGGIQTYESPLKNLKS